MKLKKALALVLACVLMMSTLAACGSNDSGKDATAGVSGSTGTGEKEPITIEFMLLNNKSGEGENFVLKEIVKEKFNIDLKLVMDTKDAYNEKLNLLVASNELPDLMSPVNGDIGKDIGPKGSLVPIDEYLDQMPNLKAKLMEDPNVYASLVASDGHIYNMPRFSDQITYKSVPLIRADMVEAVGKEMPTTWDELIDVLAAIKEKFPDSVGMINRGKMNCLWGHGVHYGTDKGMFYDKSQDKFVFGPLNAGFKEMVEDFRVMWEKGLMDKEFFTASTQQWEESILSGKGVFTLDYATRSVTETDAYKKLHPEDTTFKFVPIMPLVSEALPQPTLNISERVGVFTSFAVSADSPYIDRILEMVDWMYSEEAATLVQWGKEGVNYTVDENGMKKYVPELVATYNPDGTIDPETELGLNHDRIMRVQKADRYEDRIEGYTDVLEKYETEANLYENNNRINLTFTDEEAENNSFISINLGTIVEEEVLKFITGERDMSEYDNFLETLKKNGAEDLEANYAAAYARYKEIIK